MDVMDNTTEQHSDGRRMVRDYDQDMNRRWIFDGKSSGQHGQYSQDRLPAGVDVDACDGFFRFYMDNMGKAMWLQHAWTMLAWTKQCGCCGHGQHKRLRNHWPGSGLAHSNQHAIRSSLEHVVFERFQAISEWRQDPFFTQANSNAQRLDIQQQRHMTATFFASPRAIVYDCRRRHSRRPEACCWCRRRPRWIWSQGEDHSAAPKGFDIGLRFKVRAVRKASANHRPSFLNFFSGRKSNISCPLHGKIPSWPPFLQLFTNGGHSSTPATAWRHASDMASPRRHRSNVGSASWQKRIAPIPQHHVSAFVLSFTCIASDYERATIAMRTCLFGGGG